MFHVEQSPGIKRATTNTMTNHLPTPCHKCLISPCPTCDAPAFLPNFAAFRAKAAADLLADAHDFGHHANERHPACPDCREAR